MMVMVLCHGCSLGWLFVTSLSLGVMMRDEDSKHILLAALAGASGIYLLSGMDRHGTGWDGMD